jgi:hypothetical protein
MIYSSTDNDCYYAQLFDVAFLFFWHAPIFQRITTIIMHYLFDVVSFCLWHVGRLCVIIIIMAQLLSETTYNQFLCQPASIRKCPTESESQTIPDFVSFRDDTY